MASIHVYEQVKHSNSIVNQYVEFFKRIEMDDVTGFFVSKDDMADRVGASFKTYYSKPEALKPGATMCDDWYHGQPDSEFGAYENARVFIDMYGIQQLALDGLKNNKLFNFSLGQQLDGLLMHNCNKYFTFAGIKFSAAKQAFTKLSDTQKQKHSELPYKQAHLALKRMLVQSAALQLSHRFGTQLQLSVDNATIVDNSAFFLKSIGTKFPDVTFTHRGRDDDKQVAVKEWLLFEYPELDQARLYKELKVWWTGLKEKSN